MRTGFIESVAGLTQANKRRKFWQDIIDDAYADKPDMRCPFNCGEEHSHKHIVQIGSYKLGEVRSRGARCGAQVGTLAIFHAVRLVEPSR